MIKRPVNKEKIRHAFSKAATTYEDCARVQKASMERLLSLLEKGSYEKILEIGCGTGSLTEKLARLNPNARITAVDIAPGMVEQARVRLAQFRHTRVVEADGEELPANIMAQGPYDLIISNAAFQWFADLERALKVYSNLMAPDGELVFSLFGPSTLAELQTVLNALNGTERGLVASLFPKIDELAPLMRSLFGSCNIEEQLIGKEYATLLELLSSLKQTGVAIPLTQRPLIRSRAGMTRVEQLFKKMFGNITATYQIFFVTLKSKVMQ